MRWATTTLRPREKIFRFGIKSLSLEELWMAILGTGKKGRSVQSFARLIAKKWRDGSFFHAENVLSISALGFGQAQIARILAVNELISRFEQHSNLRVQSIRDVLLLTQDFAHEKTERLRVFYCSVDARIIHQEDIAHGGINMVSVSPKEIFFPIRWHAVDSLVLCHNHPSGNVLPSAEDEVFTARIVAAAQLLGISIRDHVIVSQNQYYSFQESGLLAKILPA